jgi:hypothetical protein
LLATTQARLTASEQALEVERSAHDETRQSLRVPRIQSS